MRLVRFPIQERYSYFVKFRQDGAFVRHVRMGVRRR